MQIQPMTYDIHVYRGCGKVPDAAQGPRRGGAAAPLPPSEAFILRPQKNFRNINDGLR